MNDMIFYMLIVVDIIQIHPGVIDFCQLGSSPLKATKTPLRTRICGAEILSVDP